MTTDFRRSLSSEHLPPSNLVPTSNVDSTSTASPDEASRPIVYRGINIGSPKSQFSRYRWFYDLPLRRKQLLGLLSSEVLSVMGLVGAGALLIVAGGRAQLVNQAKSELAVTGIEYNIKVDQMGFGFRGQSDNIAIISAAQEYARTGTVSETNLDQVRQILQNEVSAHTIEYATLVGRDLRIIANANTDRTGDKFDPLGLVGTVFANPRQIKTSEIVSWEELQSEMPPLPEGFSKQDALIRYTFTPVNDPSTGDVIGVLVSGDIVNDKLPIVEETVNAFDSGYSAVYLRQEDGTFTLASSALLLEGSDASTIEANVALPSTDILDAAVQQDGEPVTRRIRINNQMHTVAAETVDNFSGEPVALLVRGTSEASLNALIRSSLLLQLLVALIAIAINILFARFLGFSIATPIEELRRAALRFASGDRSARAEIFSRDEIGDLANEFNQLADAIVVSEQDLQSQYAYQEDTARKANLIADLTSRIRQTLNIDAILATSVHGVREVLEADRVVIYRFNPDFKSGVISTESVARGWLPAKGQLIHDPLVPGAIERYRSGRISTMENIDEASLSDCHCDILRKLEVKANIVAPILVGDDLIGLLCVHQCSSPRRWQQSDIDVTQQISVQMGYALSQAMTLDFQKTTAERERSLNRIVFRMRETLDVDQIYRTVVRETREGLGCDRAIVYLFDDQWFGRIVAESVSSDFPAALDARIADPCFAEKYVEKYRLGRVQATPNLEEADLTDCHRNQLAPYQVKANIVAPILIRENLFGLLVAHQCSGPRQWSELDINFMRQVAIQLGFALEQAQIFSEKEEARRAAEQLSDEQRRQTEALQMQLLELLGDVEGAAHGDLTVRADVTAGEIGTVADFFNSIIESLRQIVVKVKASAEQVNESLGDNEGAIQQLAEEALQQAEETTRTLDSMEQITASIQQVAQQAQQAAIVARTASERAEVGGSAMDRTVQNILNLRETIGETAKKVKRLGESSQQISKVVSLINQIAMQTNLLAINAGIEAARAGEEGQGFAVVAEEVGELAARSAAATQEIERIVENIQRETSQVVEAMELSTTEVVEGTQLVEDAKESLSDILAVSRQIDELVQSVSEATQTQVQTTSSVTQLLKEIASVSERTSFSSRQVSEALRQTVQVAQELQNSVGTFEVGAK